MNYTVSTTLLVMAMTIKKRQTYFYSSEILAEAATYFVLARFLQNLQRIAKLAKNCEISNGNG
jgi:hypothetical protein